MTLPKSVAQKQSDGGYMVRVFHAPDRSTNVEFPPSPESELLALEYANFKNDQRESGPDSPATQAILHEAKKAQDPLDQHENLMERAGLTPTAPVAASLEQSKLEIPAAPAPTPEVVKVPVPAGDTNPEVKALEAETKEEEFQGGQEEN